MSESFHFPLGVIDNLVPEIDCVDRYKFWLLLHAPRFQWDCERIMRIIIHRECLPDPNDELHFAAAGAFVNW